MIYDKKQLKKDFPSYSNEVGILFNEYSAHNINKRTVYFECLMHLSDIETPEMLKNRILKTN